MKQGDIIWVDFDPAKGREQAGYRLVGKKMQNSRTASKRLA